MDDVTGEEITDWISAINQLNENTVTDGTATFEAHEAVQRLWSGFGWTGAPHEVILMLIKAVETGYGLAGSYSGLSWLERIEPGWGGGGRVGLIAVPGR
jgi:hypothetical protein